MAILQRESHKCYSPPTSVKWLQLLGKQRNTGTSTALMAERHWSIAHNFARTPDMWHQPVTEDGDFVELLLLHMFIYFVKVKFADVPWHFRLLVSKARVRAHVPRCGFIGWLSGTGTFFLLVFLFSTVSIIQPKLHIYYKIQSGSSQKDKRSKPGDLLVRMIFHRISVRFKKER